nr:hypothetical protein [Tanacetum cinerariifolium]
SNEELKDPKEDPADYPADRGNNDDDESSNDDDVEKDEEDKEEEQHLALADPFDVSTDDLARVRRIFFDGYGILVVRITCVLGLSCNMYKDAIIQRFGTVFDDHMAKLKNVTYKTNAKAYQDAFDNLLSKVEIREGEEEGNESELECFIEEKIEEIIRSLQISLNDLNGVLSYRTMQIKALLEITVRDGFNTVSNSKCKKFKWMEGLKEDMPPELTEVETKFEDVLLLQQSYHQTGCTIMGNKYVWSVNNQEELTNWWWEKMQS